MEKIDHAKPFFHAPHVRRFRFSRNRLPQSAAFPEFRLSETMIDTVDAATRSRIMSRIRGRDTKPEMILRRALHSRGFRYRLHVRNLPGKPDIVLPKHQAVIFMHGCFWHRHENCRYATIPATRTEFWQAKFASNVERDRTAREALASAGWRIATVWGCALRNADVVLATVGMVVDFLKSDGEFLELGQDEVAPNTTKVGNPDRTSKGSRGSTKRSRRSGRATGPEGDA